MNCSADKFFKNQLLTWFKTHARELPWRNTRDPYKIWISEIMLQQTQVDRVIDYYHRFLKKFPTIKKLAAAEWEEVLAIWQGLGYYRRGRNMLRCAQALVANAQGAFPHTVDQLEKLPGIGPYTARAIAVFAYEQNVLVLDTNTSRVLARFLGLRGDDLLKKLAAHATHFVPRGKAWDFHQALMDFGANVCTAKDPLCLLCPMQKKCFFKNHRPKTIDQRPKSKKAYGTRRTTHDVAVAVIHQNGKILITKRPKGKHLAGFWEFPGGKRQKGEDWRHCLKREIKEELGIDVAVRPHDWKVDYDYSDRSVHLRFHRCSILQGMPQGKEKQKIKWVKPSELLKFKFPPANQQVLPALAKARFVDPQK